MNQADLFSVHPDPVWRDRANFIINAPLPEEGRFEQLWCRKVSDVSYEICCIPFFLYDVALGDIVETTDSDSARYILSRVVTPSGRYVFRVHFDATMLQKREEVVEELSAMGVLIEESSQTLLAVDCMDADHAGRLADYLAENEQRGRLLFETGRSV